MTALVFLRAMRRVLRISRKSYSGFMCLAASLPDAAVGRWRVFCVNGGTFCLDGAIPFFFLSFSVIPVQNIAISCGVFPDFLCCYFFFFAEASLCSVPKPKLSSFLHLPTAAVADRYTARFLLSEVFADMYKTVLLSRFYSRPTI